MVGDGLSMKVSFRLSECCRTSSILALAALALTACSEDSPIPEPTTTSTTTSQTTTVPEETAVGIGECIEKFSAGRDLWGDNPVLATFAYDLGELDEAALQALIQQLREREGSTHLIFNTGSAAPAAAEEFLSSEQEKDAEFFQAGAIRILRIRNTEAVPFDEALQAGCEAAPEGATIRQVSFSQGNS